MKYTSPEGWSIDSANWAVNTLLRMYDRGEIDFDAKVQRDFVWNKKKSSKYIQSLLWGMLVYNIPHLYSKHDGVYYSIDGQQRALTLIKFCKNEYKLTGLEDYPVSIDGQIYQINGKYFKNLAPKLQEMILDYQINVAVLEDAPESVEGEFFTRANSGIVVSKKDTAFAKAISKDEILELCNHELLSVMFPKQNGKQTDKKEMVTKTYITLNEVEPSYTEKHYRDVLEKTEFTEDDVNQISSLYDKILSAYKTVIIQDKDAVKKFVSRIHMLSYIPFVDKFDDPDMLARWFLHFNKNMTERYMVASNQQTTSQRHIRDRVEEVNDSIDKFLSDNQF